MCLVEVEQLVNYNPAVLSKLAADNNQIAGIDHSRYSAVGSPANKRYFVGDSLVNNSPAVLLVGGNPADNSPVGDIPAEGSLVVHTLAGHCFVGKNSADNLQPY